MSCPAMGTHCRPRGLSAQVVASWRAGTRRPRPINKLSQPKTDISQELLLVVVGESRGMNGIQAIYGQVASSFS